MSATARLWFAVVVALILVFAMVQAHDAYVWATSPWLHLTLGGHGRIVTRGLAEAPAALRGPLGEGPVRALAVRVGENWTRLAELGDPPRAAYDRLRRALGDLPADGTVVLRILSSAGTTSEVTVAVDHVPGKLVFERCGLYCGMGFIFAVFGVAVFHARPASQEGFAFAVSTVVFGVELMLSQVVGGFPSRFTALWIAACFAVPPAAVVLALALEPPAWIEDRPWLRSLPWAVAMAGVFAASLDGSLGDDGNVYIRTLRILAYAFFVAHLLAARWVAGSPRKRRELELYLVGIAVPMGVPTLHYSLRMSNATQPSAYVMLSLLAYPTIIGYGILKHRLFDIELLFRRGVAYAALATVAVTVYTGLIAAASVFLPGGVAGSAATSGVFLGTALIAGGALRTPLQRLVDRRLNPSRFRYLETLRVASMEMLALDNGGAAAQALVRTVIEVAEMSGAAVFLARGATFPLAAQGGTMHAAPDMTLEAEEPLVSLARLFSSEIHIRDFEYNPKLAPLRSGCVARMAALGAELVFPLSAPDGALVGLLAVASRADQEPLRSEELSMLRTLARQAAAVAARESSREAMQSTVSGPFRRPSQQPDDSVLAITPGARVLHYRIEAELGVGGMAAVWRAIDERLERVVALKFLHGLHAGSALTLERLRREARVLAALNHPNVMRIYALEEVSGVTFLAIEYLDGVTLAQELKARGAFPASEAAAIGIEVATGLSYALESGVLHRDVTLRNVMRTRAGVIKLTDFGLARPLLDGEHLTAAGKVVGTRGYLAPEVARGEPATFHSDMYSLGVLLYALLVGNDGRRTRSFAGPMVPIGEGIPEALAGILGRMLEPDPSLRHPSYALLLEDLGRVGGSR